MDDGRGRSSVLDRSTPDLIRRLIDDANGLVELQIRLAKLEAKENLLSVLAGAKTLGVAAGVGVLALIGLGVLIVTGLAAIFRAIGVPVLNQDWFWALVLVVASGGVAALLGLRGFRKLKVSPLERTRETLREDIEWLRQPTKPSGR
jgi:uncharacterized membrane protein YqjE